MRVLVVEDEELLAIAIAKGLRAEGMAVDIALNGEDAMFKAGVNEYDVVVLDRDLPLVHGDDVCRSLKSSENQYRVLMLTASGAVDARVEGLSIGADDYVAKPFAFRELVARIRALARRPAGIAPVLQRAGVNLDPARREVTRDGRQVRLTAREFAVLETLLAAQGRVVSQEELLERAWDENVDPFTNSPRVIVMRLRKKLGDPPVIKTEIGMGYRL